MRLIDADVLADKFWQEECRTQTRRDFVAMVNYAPTVDAVPVVRCKDCKYLYNGRDAYCCSCHSGLVLIHEDSFCSHGKRRAGNG